MRVLPWKCPCSSFICFSKCSPGLCSPSALKLEDRQQVTPSPSSCPDSTEEKSSDSNAKFKVAERTIYNVKAEETQVSGLVLGKEEEGKTDDDKGEGRRVHGKADEGKLAGDEHKGRRLDHDKDAEGRLNDAGNEICLKSSLKNPSESHLKEVGRGRVKWMDLVGKELVEVREFESNELGDSGGECNVYRSCICVIQ